MSKSANGYGVSEVVRQDLVFNLQGLNPQLEISTDKLHLQVPSFTLPCSILSQEAVEYIAAHTEVTEADIERLADKLMDEIHILILARLLHSRKMY